MIFSSWSSGHSLGLFPLRGSDKLLGPDDVTKAQQRDYPFEALAREASVWGLDPARFGSDRSVLRERVGAVAFRPHVWRGLNGPDLASRVSYILSNAPRRPDKLFVDVGGVGASVFDHLQVLGWGELTVPVDFGGAASNPRFGNKRAEVWHRMSEWIRRQGCLPSDSGVLAGELTAPSFRYKVVGKRTAFYLQSKEDLRASGQASPDEADALALTFAEVVSPRDQEWMLSARRARVVFAKCETMWGRPRVQWES